jgi:hypothetical protein
MWVETLSSRETHDFFLVENANFSLALSFKFSFERFKFKVKKEGKIVGAFFHKVLSSER